MTSVLTPQYAPIEQYALDGKQGPWSDIYSAAACSITPSPGQPPPEAASRVGKDSYRPLVETQAELFEPDVPGGGRSRPGLRAGGAAADRSRNGQACSACRWRAPMMRRRSAWSAARRSADLTPRLGGVSRETHEPVMPPKAVPPRRSATPWVLLALALTVGVAVWRCQAPLLDRLAILLPQGAQAANGAPAEAPPHLRCRRRRRSSRPPPRPCRRRRHRPSRRRRSSC